MACKTSAVTVKLGVGVGVFVAVDVTVGDCVGVRVGAWVGDGKNWLYIEIASDQPGNNPNTENPAHNNSAIPSKARRTLRVCASSSSTGMNNLQDKQ